MVYSLFIFHSSVLNILSLNVFIVSFVYIYIYFSFSSYPPHLLLKIDPYYQNGVVIWTNQTNFSKKKEKRKKDMNTNTYTIHSCFSETVKFITLKLFNPCYISYLFFFLEMWSMPNKIKWNKPIYSFLCFHSKSIFW